MSAKGVLVTSRDKTGDIISRSSGILFDDVVLLHGRHLTPLLEQEKWKGMLISVFPSVVQNSKACAFIDESLEFDISEEANDENVLPEAVERPGRRYVTAAVWKCPLVRKSVLFRTIEDESLLSCLSVFIILKIPGDDFIFSERIPRWIHKLKMPVRGGAVIVESTPTGMQAFINSWSHGVVARLHGRHDCLFLTDATVHSDCSGAPIYTAVQRFDAVEKDFLLGVVLGRNENFTCGIALLPVLIRTASTEALPPRVTSHSNLRRLVDETVGVISSGNLRGSGVVVDARRGVVLTCSHVIQNGADTKMHLKNGFLTCDVIYRIGDCDLAVLKVSPKSCLTESMDIAESPARTGDVVCLAGFPHVHPFEQNDFRPFISFGCVSKSLPYVIVCNCPVAEGSSGGAIIRDRKLLGLVSFVETGQFGFGFVLPASIFRDHIRKYIETDDVAYLKDLEAASENVKRFWSLNHSKL